MANRVEEIQNWTYLQTLPEENHGFKKIIFQFEKNKEEVIKIFSFINQDTHCQVEGFYDEKTSDFMLYCRMGFHLFHDIRFISKDLNDYEKRLDRYLFSLMENLNPNQPRIDDFFIRRKELDQWMPSDLNDKIGNMKLYIAPPNFFSTINGAVVLLDYSDFEKNNQVSFFYNRMRDDFYAEKRRCGIIERIPEFDCDSIDRLNEMILKLPDLLESFN